MNTEEVMALIRKTVEEILEELGSLKQPERDRFGAINWGDLGCIEVRWFKSDLGDEGYSVLIEEASPYSKLGENVKRMLRERGFPDVEVNTEW